jgi:hypothetical protein
MRYSADDGNETFDIEEIRRFQFFGFVGKITLLGHSDD